MGLQSGQLRSVRDTSLHLCSNTLSDCQILFTRGDLTSKNVIVSGEFVTMRVMGVVYWEHAGWYPEYEEQCKLSPQGEL